MDIGKPQRVIIVEPLRLPDGFPAEPATRPAPAEPAPGEPVTPEPAEEPAEEPVEEPAGWTAPSPPRGVPDELARSPAY